MNICWLSIFLRLVLHKLLTCATAPNKNVLTLKRPVEQTYNFCTRRSIREQSKINTLAVHVLSNILSHRNNQFTYCARFHTQNHALVNLLCLELRTNWLIWTYWLEMFYQILHDDFQTIYLHFSHFAGYISSPHVNVKLHMIRPKQVTRYSMSHKAFLVLLVSWQVFLLFIYFMFCKTGRPSWVHGKETVWWFKCCLRLFPRG